MKILDITENEDGTATLEVQFEPDEIGILLEYAVVDILKKQVQREAADALTKTAQENGEYDVCTGDN